MVDQVSKCSAGRTECAQRQASGNWDVDGCKPQIRLQFGGEGGKTMRKEISEKELLERYVTMVPPVDDQK